MRINYAYKNTLENPQYEIYENSIKVILPVTTDGSTLTKPEKEIVTLLRKNEPSRNRENSWLEKR